MPKILIDNILNNEEAWIKQKVNSIGSGDIACIAGADRFKTPLKLWAIKTRREPPDSENDHMWWGKQMEGPIAQLCKRKLDLDIEYGNQLFGHDSIPWATATPDYFATGLSVPFENVVGVPAPIGERMILECKNVSFRGRQFWMDDTPLAPRIQVMWQMGIAGINRAVIAPLIGGDHEAFEARYVRYDARIMDQLLQLADQFMWHVQKDVPPAAQTAADSKVIDKIWPELEDRLMPLPDDFAAELEEAKRLSDKRKVFESEARKLEEQEKIIKNKARLLMSGAKKAECGKYTVSVSMANVKEKITKAYSYARVTIKSLESETEVESE